MSHLIVDKNTRQSRWEDDVRHTSKSKHILIHKLIHLWLTLSRAKDFVIWNQAPFPSRLTKPPTGPAASWTWSTTRSITLDFSKRVLAETYRSSWVEIRTRKRRLPTCSKFPRRVKWMGPNLLDEAAMERILSINDLSRGTTYLFLCHRQHPSC